MRKNNTKIILLHMLEDLTDIETFTTGINIDMFRESPLLKKAVSLSLLNIGELAQSLPDDLLRRNNDIPWPAIISLRNRAAHGYHTLDPSILWEIAQNDIKPLLKAVRQEIENVDNE